MRSMRISCTRNAITKLLQSDWLCRLCRHVGRGYNILFGVIRPFFLSSSPLSLVSCCARRVWPRETRLSTASRLPEVVSPARLSHMRRESGQIPFIDSCLTRQDSDEWGTAVAFFGMLLVERGVKYPTNLSVISFQDASLASPKLSVTLFKDHCFEHSELFFHVCFSV